MNIRWWPILAKLVFAVASDLAVFEHIISKVFEEAGADVAYLMSYLKTISLGADRSARLLPAMRRMTTDPMSVRRLCPRRQEACLRLCPHVPTGPRLHTQNSVIAMHSLLQSTQRHMHMSESNLMYYHLLSTQTPSSYMQYARGLLTYKSHIAKAARELLWQPQSFRWLQSRMDETMVHNGLHVLYSMLLGGRGACIRLEERLASAALISWKLQLIEHVDAGFNELPSYYLSLFDGHPPIYDHSLPNPLQRLTPELQQAYCGKPLIQHLDALATEIRQYCCGRVPRENVHFMADLLVTLYRLYVQQRIRQPGPDKLALRTLAKFEGTHALLKRTLKSA